MLPATYIVGPDGVIRYRHPGELDWSNAEVREAIVRLMKGEALIALGRGATAFAENIEPPPPLITTPLQVVERMLALAGVGPGTLWSISARAMAGIVIAAA